MFESLKQISDTFNMGINDKYIIESNCAIEYILNLFNNGTIDDKTLDVNKLIWNGLYCQFVLKDYEKMKKYYSMAIKLGNSNAMNILACYYDDIEKNHKKAEKYYLMAIELGDSNSMYNLAHYYNHVEINHELMKKYYLMAIELGNSCAMNNLAHYYQHIEKNNKLMKKYCLMAIELGNSCAMNNLAHYYHHVEKNHDLMKKYYLMAIESGNSSAMNNLAYYYHHIKKNNLMFYGELSKLNQNKLIKNKLNELENSDKQIIIYKNKIRLFKELNNYKQCKLCLENDVLNIDLNCGHDMCIDCYQTYFKCYYAFCNC